MELDPFKNARIENALGKNYQGHCHLLRIWFVVTWHENYPVIMFKRFWGNLNVSGVQIFTPFYTFFALVWGNLILCSSSATDIRQYKKSQVISYTGKIC